MKAFDVILCDLDMCQELLRNLSTAAEDIQNIYDHEEQHAYFDLNIAIAAAEYFLKDR